MRLALCFFFIVTFSTRELLEHTDVSTTMIYTHAFKSRRTLREEPSLVVRAPPR